jgi:hypothetical protein
MPVSGQLCEAAAGRSSPCPGFLWPFGLPALACRTILSRRRSWAFLAVGLPDYARTSTGFPRCAQPRPDRRGCPLYPGATVFPRPAPIPRPPPPFPNGQALPPALRPISGGPTDEASTKVSLALTRPVFPLPVVPVWSGRPWASSPMLQTPPLPATPVRVGTDHEHFSGFHRRLHPVPPIGGITRAVRPRVANRIVGQPPAPWLPLTIVLLSSESPLPKAQADE